MVPVVVEQPAGYVAGLGSLMLPGLAILIFLIGMYTRPALAAAAMAIVTIAWMAATLIFARSTLFLTMALNGYGLMVTLVAVGLTLGIGRHVAKADPPRQRLVRGAVAAACILFLAIFHFGPRAGGMFPA